jgi:hypothetical protein
MSVRAHRIKKIDFEKQETFNLWHDEKLMDFLNEHGIYDTLNECCGLTELPVSVLEEAIKEVKELDKYTRKAIEKDIAWAKKNKEDYIQYYCF